jgi:hypothetical protein
MFQLVIWLGSEYFTYSLTFNEKYINIPSTFIIKNNSEIQNVIDYIKITDSKLGGLAMRLTASG